ncbi:ABC transporter ATP-binding protein [Pseudoclostridium thermosuccinogenes]|nr:ABC transporter ATP-binding protein [Pseudoclostridium thermosuccinogenes]AUS95404.1 peptide ABC transporter ATP-binding protein [Pseudoclostridium thermosuccinogenes]AUS96501.1 peptide ABC transporter ATP-binding protein [Pseudoclostridium thermosuccinogenes]PNT90538.1 peptide ABC transporter ATP-binding protein [Pseudoclostridium thermosuccinogenes]PNT92836.1 peptide ABC transporter ATP-binding protein [Pseudoclostridium thermosuccinogenes]PNT94878.1 peptide ABC transporter ATP-binding pr
MTDKTNVNDKTDAKVPLVELNNLEMNFYKSKGMFRKPQELNALHNINLKIHNGEIVVVVGESGSGKTTLANVIAGLLTPVSGTYKFKGKEIHSMTKEEANVYRSSIQVVQQDSYAALNPMRTMIKSLGDPMLLKKYATKDNLLEKVNEVLEAVDLTPTEHFINKYPHQMSGGQRQRALIARALSMNPELILADEPVSMIDVSLRVSILNLLARLNEERNIAILYITHDLATARYVGKNGRIAVMYLGEIVETGDLQEVLSNPQHPYLRALLTAVPIPNPRLSRKRKELQLNASSELPDISNMPSGCRFHTRCMYCKDICKVKHPEPVKHGSSIVTCHLVDELPKFELFTEDVAGA